MYSSDSVAQLSHRNLLTPCLLFDVSCELRLMHLLALSSCIFTILRFSLWSNLLVAGLTAKTMGQVIGPILEVIHVAHTCT